MDIEKDKCNINSKNKINDLGLILELSETFKVFADPTRISILYSLMDGELCVCHIADKISMSQSAVSHQLKTLRTARLIKARKEGKVVYYSLDDEHIEKILNVVMEHVKEGEV